MNVDDGSSDGERQLWAAVILQALEDAMCVFPPAANRTTQAKALSRKQARDWFIRAGRDFRDVCALAGVDHGAVRREALEKIEAADNAAQEHEAGRPKPKRYSHDGRSLSLKE